MEKENKIKKQLLEEIEGLRIRLKEAEETLNAIRSGGVDAIVVSGLQGEQVFTLTGAERAYRVLIETMNEGAAVLNQEGMIIYCNQRLSEMIKTPLEKVIGAPMRQFIRASDLPAFDSLIEKGLQKSGKGEVAFIKNDGSVLPVLLSISALQRDNANVGSIVVTDLTAQKHIEEELRRHRDNLEELVKDRTNELETSNQSLREEITERRQAEQALKAERQRLHDVLEAMPIMVCLLTPDYHVVFANRAFREKFGESHGRHCYDYCFGKKEPCDFCETYRVLKTGKPHHWQVTTPDGASVIDVYDFPFTDVDGSPMILEMDIDITERKRAEEALRESEEEYRTLFEDSKDVVYISTIEGKYLDINSAGVALFGYDSKEEIMKVNIAKDIYFNPYDRKKFIQTIEQQGFVKDYELLMKRRDGEILTLLSTTTPYRDKEGKITEYRGIMRDVTQQRKLEQQLIHAQKMEAVGQLTGGIAHDFNNILQAIISYADLLKMKMRKDDPLRRNADQIIASSERAANLVQSLLAFSRKQIMNLQPVKINEIVKRVEKLLSRIIGEDIEMKTILNPPTPPVIPLHPPLLKGDREGLFEKESEKGFEREAGASEDLIVMADSGQIEQVLMNLATNARGAMPDGGLLMIETERIEIDGEYIKTHGYGEPGIYALISVTDTGKGMDEQTRERIFETFFTTKEVGKGTGLGLSMVYGIIKQHNGYINVYSESGKGTTFKIYLPLTKKEVKEIKPTEPAPSIEGIETILLAEDDADVRKFTKHILEEFGYTVIEAVDGGDAINKFMENRDKIELLILDVVMPKKNGREVYDEIKKTRPDIKVLFMSGYTANVIHKQGILEEGLNFVLKPISPTVLLRKIRGLLEGR